MVQVSKMTDAVRSLIQFSLQRFDVSPVFDSAGAIVYRLEYESGLSLVFIIIAIEQRRLLLWKKPLISISVAEYDNEFNLQRRHLTHYLAAPASDHDLEFSMQLAARFASMTRAVADTLNGGECLSIK